jgi:hypothetical protein
MPTWIKILIALLPKKALAELILSVLKDFAKKTKVTWDDEFLENLEKWLRENEFLNPLQIVKVKENLKKYKISQGEG